jgi:hypothetical protein
VTVCAQVKDGRRTLKDSDHKQNNKLHTQLGKIEKVFHEKGYTAGKAFNEGESGEAPAATPARKKARLAGV